MTTPIPSWSADDVAMPGGLTAEVARAATDAVDLVIAGPEDYAAAAERLLGLAQLVRQVRDYFKPLREAANALRAALIEREAQVVKPVELAIDRSSS